MTQTHSQELISSYVSQFIPDRRTEAIDWQALTPFAAWLVEAVQPSCLIELGTYKGDSYCAFCQAVRDLKIACRCFSVDTWAGDEHVGQYDQGVFDQLSDYHDCRYGLFSQLSRMTFEEALDTFEDHSAQIIHIDGLHTYEAVCLDYERYQAKLAPGGVMLFHDTAIRERGFGVWRLWAEIMASGVAGWEMPYSRGLGVLVLEPDHAPPRIQQVLSLLGTERFHDWLQIMKALGDRIVLLAKADYFKSDFERIKAMYLTLSQHCDRASGYGEEPQNEGTPVPAPVDDSGNESDMTTQSLSDEDVAL